MSTQLLNSVRKGGRGESPEPLSGRELAQFRNRKRLAARSMIRTNLMPGPKGNTNHVNRDSYDGSAPVAGILPAPAKQINAADAKLGPPAPTSGRRGAGINRDSYYE